MLSNIKSIKALISPLTAFFCGAMFVSMAYALLNSILAIDLNDAGIPTFYSGLVLSMYYVGYIVATTSSYKVINSVGHIRAFSTYVSVMSALVLMHTLWFNIWYWGGLRLLEGYCMASAFVCLESWLNTRANNQNRGFIMSCYMVTSYIGAASGQLILNIPDSMGFVLVMLVSIIYSIALVPISLTALPSPDISKHKQMSLLRLYKISPVGVMGCVISGIMVGGVYTLGTIYAQSCGLSLYNVSLFMFFSIFGGMLAQFPIGRLSDKFDRRFVMMWTCGGVFFILPWMHILISGSIAELIPAALLLGSGTFVLYPICVSHVNDKIEDDERVEACGVLLMLQSIGMIIGPITISFLMQQFGSIFFLISLSSVSGFFVLFSLKHISFKQDVGYKTITPTDPMPLAPTHVFSELAKNDTILDKAKNIFMPKNKD